MKNRILTLTIAALLISAAVFTAAAQDISPSLSVLRERTVLTKSTVGNGDMYFTLNEFEQALGVDDLTYITVVSLPDPGDGALKLGGVDVMVSQVIPRGSLDFLRFVPKDGAENAKFTFRGNAEGWEQTEVLCEMNFLKTINFAPTAENMTLETVCGVCAVAELSGNDPDGDEVRYEIVSYADKGLVSLNGNTVSYTPFDGFKGRDSFEYRVVDKYGNVSKTATAKITVKQNKAGIVYLDMQGNPAHTDAVALAAMGIVCHENIAGVYYFSPERTVTRNDFVVMLAMAGEIDVSGYSATVFADDGEIAAKHRPYIAAAYKAGLFDAVDRDGKLYFEPDAPVTRAQAAMMISRLLDIEGEMSLSVFGDADKVPADSVAAFAGLCENGIITALPGGLLEPNGALTRAQTASILMNMIEHTEKTETKSFLERLFG